MTDIVCAACGSKKMVSDVRIVDYMDPLTKRDLAAELHERPDAWVFKGAKQAILKATLCGDCGRVEMKVDNPHELWEIYQKQQRDWSGE